MTNRATHQTNNTYKTILRAYIKWLTSAKHQFGVICYIGRHLVNSNYSTYI